ncbi:MAG: hemerythrin family protein [Magnetococcales bacterium]|nr:hemerythrin family protein [Magnetococcales bacterium]
MPKLFVDKTTLGSPHRIGYSYLLKIGHPELDQHHHDILSLLIHLAELIKKQKWVPGNKMIRDHVINLLTTIRDTMGKHAEAEENIMRHHGYPLLQQHEDEHDLLLVRLDGFIYHCRHHGHPSVKQVKDFIRQWFLTHVNESDIQFRDFLLVEPAAPPHPHGEAVSLLGR